MRILLRTCYFHGMDGYVNTVASIEVDVGVHAVKISVSSPLLSSRSVLILYSSSAMRI